MKLRRRAILASLFASAVACSGPRAAPDPRAACGKLHGAACTRALGLLAAAGAYADLGVPFALDPLRKLAPGRGLERTARGEWRATALACASTATTARTDPPVAPDAIDFAYVGLTIDGAFVAPDADVDPLAGPDASAAHTIAIVAFALTRAARPAFFDAAPSVVSAPAGCACGGATHFAGASRDGGLLAFEMTLASRDLRGRALAVARRALASGRAVTETRLGGLDVRGLEPFLDGGPARPLSFTVASAVPVAAPVHPIADVCPYALPAPEVGPVPLDFGDAPYGTEAIRPLHVVNRASVELDAILGARTFAIPPRASLDIPLPWSPDGDAPGCEVQTREETILFVPRGARTPLSPPTQTAQVLERVRTGRPSVTVAERIEAAPALRPRYAATVRDWTCPRDFVVTVCRAERPQCSDPTRTCEGGGFAVSAAQTGNGCHFGCAGPSPLEAPGFCRFDATMECRLQCAGAPN